MTQMTARAELDTTPHPKFPVYSAGNFGEVAPERLSVMAWSLVGNSVERANRRIVSEYWPSATWHNGSGYVFVGYFNCRPYHNLSAYCYTAAHIPRLDPAGVAESYFEDAAVPRLPARLGAGRGARIWALQRMVRGVLDIRPRAIELDGRVSCLEAAVERSISAGEHFDLASLWHQGQDLIDEIWNLHYFITMSLVPLRAVQRSLGMRLIERWDDIEPWVNAPPELVWPGLFDAAGSEHLQRGLFLSHGFYEIADDRAPWRDYACRGSAQPVGEAVATADTEIADKVWEMSPQARIAGLPLLARAVDDTMATRECSKSLAMRAMHVFRRLAPSIAALRMLADQDWPYLTAGELIDSRHSASELAAIATARRRACEEALFRDTPELIDTASPAGDRVNGTAPRRARGVSPGHATGIVVGREEARPDDERSQILVCESADADIQPLLRFVSGVVTARGSTLSHLAILVREHGVPAVVGADISMLTPGTEISLDGSSGEVLIHGASESSATALLSDTQEGTVSNAQPN